VVDRSAARLQKLWPLFELGVSAPQPLSERVSLCEFVALMCEEPAARVGEEDRQPLAW